MMKVIEFTDKENKAQKLRVEIRDDNSVEFMAKAGEWASIRVTKEDAQVISAMLSNLGG